jgi:RNA polymerase sigma-70 factor (ECF subfamily)
MAPVQFHNALLQLQGKLHYYALSLTSDSEKANDLLQETFLKALKHREKFTQNTNFKAWTYTIMRNTFINEYRRKARAQNTFDIASPDFHLLYTKDKMYPAPDSFYSAKEITNCINELDDDFKVPFNLFLEGYKYKEIAEELDLPLGTVKSRIFFTRKKLEKTLREYSNN